MKKTKMIFEGTINGQTFDNVADYNNYITDLLNSGETNIQANSSTRVVPIVEEDKTKLNMDVYPYMYKDTHYLNKLVSTDHDANVNKLYDIDDELKNLFSAITEFIDQPERTQYWLYTYAERLDDILSFLKQDNDKNEEALERVRNRREQLEKELVELAEAEVLLCDSAPVIECFEEFYSRLKTWTKNAIEHKNTENENKKEHCNCNNANTISATCTETKPTTVYTLSDIFGSIFGDRNPWSKRNLQ